MSLNSPKMTPQCSERTVYLWAVPLKMIWVNSDSFGLEHRKRWGKIDPRKGLFGHVFRFGVTLFKPNFLSPPWSKMKNFSAHQKVEDLRISKLTLLLFLVPFLGEFWPLKTWETFFGTPCM